MGNGETIVIEFLQFYVEKSILSGVDCSDTFSVSIFRKYCYYIEKLNKSGTVLGISSPCLLSLKD